MQQTGAKPRFYWLVIILAERIGGPTDLESVSYKVLAAMDGYAQGAANSR